MNNEGTIDADETFEILPFPLDGNMRSTVIEETARGLTITKKPES